VAGRTPYYGLGYFDFRDRLDAAVSVQLEQERFLTIDRQIFGMYAVFGNGVVTGLSVSASTGTNTGASISVSPGIAFVQGRAVYVDSPIVLSGMPSGENLYIYLRVLPGFGPGAGSLFYSYAPSLPNSVRLAGVRTGFGTIEEVDNEVKQQISFRSLVLSELAKHKHRGSPSRIDLLREVKNFLPGARVGDLSADQVAYGQLSVERIPRLSHSNLRHSGTLSHAGLESLARSLQTSDRVLLGEVTAVNQLQQNIAFRRSHPDHPDYHVNSITYVPGTASDGIIDFANTTALYSPSSGCFAGRQQTAGLLVNITYNTTSELSRHYAAQGVVVADGDAGGLTLSSNINEESVLFRDSFEGGTDVGVPGFEYRVETSASTVSVSGDSLVQTDGVRSAKLRSGVRHRLTFRKTISGDGNWSNFSTLFLHVRCISESHPAVFMYLVNQVSAESSPVNSAKIVILAANEVTSNPDPTMDNFKLVEYNLLPFERSAVKSIVFEVEDASVDFTFNIDDVRTSSAAVQDIFYQPSGIARYRYVSSSPYVLNSIMWNPRVIPDGCSVEVRYRSGMTTSDIDSALFEGPLSQNGQSINVSALLVDVEVALRSNSARTLAPILKDFTIQIRVDGTESGFSFNSAPLWETCQLINAYIVSLPDSSSGVQIAEPIEVGKLFYSSNDSIQLMSDSYVSEFGYLGADLPVSPAQASRPSYVWQAEGLSSVGFDQASGLCRLTDKSFLVADTYNNRVIQVSRDGHFVRGVGNSEPLSTGDQFVPLCAVLNPRTRLLQVVFSRPITVGDDFDITKCTIVLGSENVRANALDSVVTGGGSGSRPPNVLQIRLSADKVNLVNIARENGLQVFCRVDASAFGVPSYSNSALLTSNYSLNGLRLFVGDFTYLNAVYRPVSAEDYDGDWLICNSAINFDRIRAGLRPDTDEYFLNIQQGSEPLVFNISYRFPQGNLDENGNPYKVYFVQALAGSAGGSAPVLQGTPQFAGTVQVVQESAYGATVTITPPSGNAAVSHIGVTYLLNLQIRIVSVQAEESGNATVEVPATFSPASYSFRITCIDEVVSEEPISAPSVPTIVKLRSSDWLGTFAYGSVSSFAVSDFTLGSAVKYSNGRVLAAGLDFSDGESPPINPSEADMFVGQALVSLAPYRGRVVVINADGTRAFQYTSPDGLYPSDASVAQDGTIIIAESSVGSASGRVIRIDDRGQVLSDMSNGTLGIVNDARETSPGITLVST
jgi:hypothetical protein